MTAYGCLDVRLHSDLELPELAIAQDDDDRELVRVRLQHLTPTLADGAPGVDGLQISGDAVQFDVPDVARYRVIGGHTILVDARPGADAVNVRLFLLGSALGLLSHQRGLLPIHANAFVSGDRAFAFAGPSGAGKSTLAAHFERLGHQVLCDDVCAISFDVGGRPLAWPGPPRLKLWGDAASAFGLQTRELSPAIGGEDKWNVPMGRPAPRTPVPFARLYVLGRASPDLPASIRRLKGREAMAAVRANTYRGSHLAEMGLAAAHFERCAALLRHVYVYAVSRVWGYDIFEEEAARLVRHVHGGDA